MAENAISTTTAAHPAADDGPGVSRVTLFERALLSATDKTMRRHGIGRIRIEMPSGGIAIIGDHTQAPCAELAVRSYRGLWSIARRGSLGFAEAYMNGWIDTPDLGAAFEYYLANESAIVRALPKMNDTAPRDRRYHRRRHNSVDGSRRNIADHYDLGNDFYRLWLDPSMLYSSGIYRGPDMELEAAQREKLAVIFKALELTPGHSLLEIGCGWGTIAEAAAHSGARVRAITISEQQRRAATARIAASELSHGAEIVFEDYRQTSGQFDRIVSIEMIEAVGEENWSAYFDVIARRMRPDAVAVIQAITIREDAFARYRANPDFIQRYIFPGGMLPTVEIMNDCAGKAGLQFETVERFGASYVATLSDWRQRFLAAWPAIEALGFDERFKRMWLYYLDYCTIGFKRGWIDVGLYRMRRSDVAPALRDDGEARGG